MMHEHALVPSKYEAYDACQFCGSLFRRDHPPASIYLNYWDCVERSTLEDQVYNITEFKSDAGETKADAVLRYARKGFMALEIGCGPGALLPLLLERFPSVTGIEYNPLYRDRIETIAGKRPELIFGAFPEVTKGLNDNLFDCIIALDVLEHVADGQAFIAEVHRLLSHRGRAILMLPALFDDGEFDPRFLHPEHLAIYSQAYLREWLEPMFAHLRFDRWVVGHEMVVLDR